MDTNYTPEEWEGIIHDDNRAWLFVTGYIHENNMVLSTTHDYRINDILDKNILIGKNELFTIFNDWKKYGPIEESKSISNPKIEDMDMFQFIIVV